jgi:hypothetical protein
MESKLFKGIILLSFITLVSAFLLYSAGYFDGYVNRSGLSPQSPNNLIPQEIPDSAIPVTSNEVDTQPAERLPSSKSVMVPIERFSARRKKAIRLDTTFSQKEIRMMSSSKSGRIIDAATFDSLLKKLDSPKIEKKQNK